MGKGFIEHYYIDNSNTLTLNLVAENKIIATEVTIITMGLFIGQLRRKDHFVFIWSDVCLAHK